MCDLLLFHKNRLANECQFNFGFKAHAHHIGIIILNNVCEVRGHSSVT